MVCNTTGNDGTYFFFITTGIVLDATADDCFISSGMDNVVAGGFCCNATIDAIICAAKDGTVLGCLVLESFVLVNVVGDGMSVPVTVVVVVSNGPWLWLVVVVVVVDVSCTVVVVVVLFGIVASCFRLDPIVLWWWLCGVLLSSLSI